MGRSADKALHAGRATVLGGHVGLGPGLVDEDQTAEINLSLILLPLTAPPSTPGQTVNRVTWEQGSTPGNPLFPGVLVLASDEGREKLADCHELYAETADFKRGLFHRQSS